MSCLRDIVRMALIGPGDGVGSSTTFNPSYTLWSNLNIGVPASRQNSRVEVATLLKSNRERESAIPLSRIEMCQFSYYSSSEEEKL